MTEKQQKILSSAQKLFALDGVAAVSTARIAKEAGVSEALIFRHFGNKQLLVNAVVKAGLSVKSSIINVREKLIFEYVRFCLFCCFKTIARQHQVGGGPPGIAGGRSHALCMIRFYITHVHHNCFIASPAGVLPA